MHMLEYEADLQKKEEARTEHVRKGLQNMVSKKTKLFKEICHALVKKGKI